MTYNLKKNTRRAALTCAGALALLLSTNEAQACSEDAYLGSICTTANYFCPAKYTPAEGQTLQITGNEALYSLLGSNFGGDGRTYFRLPDLRSRTPVGIGGTLNFRIGQQYGQETVTLTENQMEAHTHDATYTAPSSQALPLEIHASQVDAQKEVPASGDMFAATPMNGFIPSAQVGQTAVQIGGLENSSGANVVVGSTGGGQPFSIIDPQTATLYCIKTDGLYPPRSDYE